MGQGGHAQVSERQAKHTPTKTRTTCHPQQSLVTQGAKQVTAFQKRASSTRCSGVLAAAGVAATTARGVHLPQKSPSWQLPGYPKRTIPAHGDELRPFVAQQFCCRSKPFPGVLLCVEECPNYYIIGAWHLCGCTRFCVGAPTPSSLLRFISPHTHPAVALCPGWGLSLVPVPHSDPMPWCSSNSAVQ